MVTIKGNPVVITQKGMIKKSEHVVTKRHQNIKKRQRDKKQGAIDL